MTTKEIIDRIFKDPSTKYELTEFENLGKPIHEILSIFPKTAATGRDAGKTKYYLKSCIPFFSGNEEVQVYVEGGKSAPEEIVRQLWVYKLINQYGYRADEIELEASVQFGTEVGIKAADILVPRLKEEIECRIAAFVEESLTKRVEYETLLYQAKARVEQLIEEAVAS